MDSGSAPFSYVDSGVALLNIAGTVDITGMANTAAIQSSITAELAKAGISTVTVTGSFTTDDTLHLIIPEGKTVVWKANYTSTASIHLSGGAFTHSAGQISAANGISSADVRLTVTGSAVMNGGITVSGGSIEVAGNARVFSPDGTAITIIPGAKNAKVTVRGGEIVSRTGISATAEGTQITVSGGEIVSSFNCFYTPISGTQITISGGTARLLADTTANGKTPGRMYLDTALAGNLKNDVLLGVTVDKAETAAVTELFQKHFGAKVAVVRLAHQGPFGMRVQIAVKADPTIDMTKPVYFYSYDRKTNKYLRIWNPAYTVDKNGWLYFYTEMGGDILYSNTLLS